MIIDPNNNSLGAQSLHSGKTRQPPEASAQAQSATAANSPATATDSVSLSPASRAIASLESKMANAPDVDKARVEQVKNAIDNGSYQIDSGKIAQRMLEQDSDLL